MKSKTKVAITAAILFWASAFVGIRAGLHGYSPEGLALLRFMVASLVMGIFYFCARPANSLSLKDKLGLMMVGLIGIGVYNVTLNYGEIAVSSGVASFIIAQSPVLTTAFAVLFLGEKLTLTRVSGFIISLIGVTIIAYGEIGKFELTSGLIYVLIAMASGSVYNIMQKPYTKKYSAVQTATYIIWGGTLSMLVFLPKMQFDITHADLSYTLIVIYLGIFPAALAYLAWSYTLQNLSVSHAVSYLYLLPFVTAIMGWLVLGEVPAFISIMGALIAVGGVWLVGQSYQKAAKQPAPLVPVSDAA